MPNFAQIANKKVEDIERPPLAPMGDYRWRVMKVPTISKSADEAWEFVRFPCKVVEALENVDQDEWKGDITNIILTKTFMFNCNDEAEFEKSEYNLRQFCEKHLRCVEPGMSISEMLNASINAEFIGAPKRTQDKRDESGETFNEEIGRTAPVD